MKLIIEDDEGSRTSVPFSRDEITIGRDEGHLIRLTDRNVSRAHAVLRRGPTGVSLEDLGSSYGVRVNGAQISGQIALNPSDLIEIGDYNLAFELEAGDVFEPIAHDGPTDPSAPAFSPPVPTPAAPAPTPLPLDAPSTSIVKIDVDALARSAVARAVPAGGEARLTVVNGRFEGQTFSLDRSPLELGRAPECALSLDHRSLSRRHCRFFVDEDLRWKVADLGAANGVIVNGEPYGLATLEPSDLISLGHLRLRFEPAAATLVEDPWFGDEDGALTGEARWRTPAAAAVGAALLMVFAYWIGAPGGDATPPAQEATQPTSEAEPGARAAATPPAEAPQEAPPAPSEAEGAPAAPPNGEALEANAAPAPKADEEAPTVVSATPPEPEPLAAREAAPAPNAVKVSAAPAPSAAATSAATAEPSPPSPAPPKQAPRRRPPPRKPKAQSGAAAYDAGMAFIRQGNYQEAIPKLLAALKASPKRYSEAHLYLGVAYAASGDTLKGRHHYERFVELNPFHPRAPEVRALLEQ